MRKLLVDLPPVPAGRRRCQRRRPGRLAPARRPAGQNPRSGCASWLAGHHHPAGMHPDPARSARTAGGQLHARRRDHLRPADRDGGAGAADGRAARGAARGGRPIVVGLDHDAAGKPPVGPRRVFRDLGLDLGLQITPVIWARVNRYIATSASSSPMSSRAVRPGIKRLGDLTLQQAELQRDIGRIETLRDLVARAFRELMGRGCHRSRSGLVHVRCRWWRRRPGVCAGTC